MKLCIYENSQQVAKAAAALISAQIIEKENCVLGLATGSTPIPTYQELIRLNKSGIIDFSKVVTYNLDEYLNLPETHNQSYHFFMKEQLFNHININQCNTHVPNGNAKNELEEAACYDKAIQEAGGIDIQLLGIGRNGHIGFNEPGSEFIRCCHVVDLTPSTIEANRRFFESENEVPRQAITLGIDAIMNAKKVLLLATGKDKAQAIHDMVNGDITPNCQSSILRVHPNAIVMVDQEAASLL